MPMKTTLLNNFTLRHHRSLFGPAWRYELAQTSRPRYAFPVAGGGDPWLTNLLSYLTLNARGAISAAQEKFPAIADAITLQSNADLTAKLKLMVLADMNLEVMHQLLDVPVATLQAWEAIFFDIRDLREATGWLAACVVERERKTGNTALAARMKLAISGGAVAVCAMLQNDVEIPLDEADRLFQRKLKLDLKLTEVLDLPIDSEQARLRFVEIYTEMHAETKRLELAGRKLDERCLHAREKYELAKLQAELALEREQRRTAQWRHAAEERQQRQAKRDRRQSQVQDLCKHQEHAERMALDARIAASPLAQLTWGPVAATSPCIPAAESSPLQSQKFEPVESSSGSPIEPCQVCLPETTENFADVAAQHVVCTYDQEQLACVE